MASVAHSGTSNGLDQNTNGETNFMGWTEWDPLETITELSEPGDGEEDHQILEEEIGVPVRGLSASSSLESFSSMSLNANE